MRPNPSPISTKHTSARVPRGWTPGRGGARGVSSRGPVAYLLTPGSPGRGGATAFAVAGASRRISQAAALGAPGMAPVCSGAAALFRRVPGASGVLAGTEITMQRAEAARRSRAETAGPPPPPGCGRRRRAQRQTGGGSSGAGPLIRQAGGAPVCSRRAVLRSPSIRAEGGSFAGGGSRGGGGGSSETPSSAPAAPPPSLLRPGGRGSSAAATAAARRRVAGRAGRLGFCCQETGGRWKVKKGITVKGWGRGETQQEFWPLLSLTGHQTPWLCLDSSRRFLIKPCAAKI